MINAVLVDDEPGNSRILAEMLKQYCPSVRVCGSAADMEEAEHLIGDLQPDLLFLDIRMPGGSGFDLLDRVRDTAVIFVTAYDDFLLRAIRYSALDYIMKPVNIEELKEAVKRAERKLKDTSMRQQVELLLSNIRQPSHNRKIALPSKEGYQFVALTDIVRLEAKGAYTEVFLNNGRTVLCSRNIKEYEASFPEDMFCRVHNAHLVNLHFIKTYHRGRGGYLEMTNGTSIEVAVRKKEEFLARFR